MRLSLDPHPDSEGHALSGVEVEVRRLAPRRIRLLFVATGEIRHVVLPAEVSPRQRIDGLWQHSCFEAFVRAAEQEAYYEFNFAPSGNWASYRFSSYREGMAAARNIQEPRVQSLLRLRPLTELQRSAAEAVGNDTLQRFPTPFFALWATLELRQAMDLPVDQPWQIGLSAIIEENSGRRSYWALAHPPGAPDFHHEDCFALELPPAKQS